MEWILENMIEAKKISDEDEERGHALADDVLIELIVALTDESDEEQMRIVSEVIGTYNNIYKWYA